MVLSEIDRNVLGRKLILDELFDLTLYKRFQGITTGKLRSLFDELILVEVGHVAHWQQFFGREDNTLNFGRRAKCFLLFWMGRVFGSRMVHLIVEAIEIHDVKKYLHLWHVYRGEPLEAALKEILKDELKFEHELVTGAAEQKIDAERIQNIILGMNDGLVELLGAVTGFFAAFRDPSSVLIAGFTVAAAGAISMGAGIFAATSSGDEVRETEEEKRMFLEGAPNHIKRAGGAFRSGIVVSISYFLGSMVPLLPVLFGATTILVSVISACAAIILVSLVLAFLTGMNIRRRIFINFFTIAVAVGVSYMIGLAVKEIFGVVV